MTDIIELHNLTKTFPGGIVAVNDLSFAVREGEFVTLLGPSGCGKTTTLRLVAGFEEPDAGRIVLAGRDVTDDPPYRRAVNTVFQDYALFPHMTVAQNVGYGLRIGGVARAEIAGRVQDALRMVDLLDKIDARPNQLSGGQKQRVGLARAIIRRPKVLLLDEPLSALDVKLRESMQVELKHLHQRLGITFVLVTHDQKEALVMSDRVVVMDAGRIVQAGTPGELYDHPATPYVANFIGTSNLIPARVVGVQAGELLAEAGSVRLRAQANGTSHAAGARVLLAVRPEKAVLLPPGAATSGGASAVEGRVLERFFHGNAVRVSVDIGQAEPFLVDVQLQRALGEADMPGAGASVTLAIEPGSVSVFADPGGPRP
jgi:putative spermidine/putrescine transport system ATP-binding protein/spermidine/putrescine transport system ATP-binding protein